MAKTFGPYPARVAVVHDGDSILLDIDLGFDHLISAQDWDGKTRLICRVWSINSPELSTPEGKAALAYAQTLLHPGDRVMVLSHGWDAYGGRFDGTITLADGSDFAGRMVDSGHAVPFTP